MKIRRWRRSTEAKPDGIWTKSIFHIPGLLVHAVPESRNNLEFMTGQYRHARCLSSCERTRGKWAQTGMSRRWFCPDPYVAEGNGTLEAVLVTGTASLVRTTTSRYLDLASTVGGKVGSAMWAFICHTAIPFIGWAIANWFFLHPKGTWAHSKEHSIDAAQNAPTHHTNE